MIKKWLIGLFMMSVLLLAVHLPVSAEDVTEAPGGEVTSYEELSAALGGKTTTKLEGDCLLILSDICLASPVVITEGDYVITGAGIEITASFEEGSFFEVRGEKKATLIFGSPDTQNENKNIVLNGEYKTRQGSLIAIGQGATVSLFSGTVLRDHTTEVSGGAIFSDGSFAMYGGWIENCSSMGAGGGIYSRGTVLFSSGIMIGCTAEFGGALYNEGDVTLAGTEIKECTATKGGAVFNAGELVFLSSSVFSCNASQGAGLYNSGTAELKGGQIVSCLADQGEGGGIYNSGEIVLNGAYINENAAENGGTLYNVGEAELKEGRLSDGTATEAGGHVYNEAQAKLILAGTSLERGKAKLGGGIYNLGNLTVIGGGLDHNEADFGKAIFNDGELVFKEYAYIDDNNDIFLVVDEADTHAIHLQSDMKVDLVAVLTPGIQAEEGYAYYYIEGVRLLTGDYLPSSYTRFLVSPQNGLEWYLTESGTIVKQLPIYRQPWFYFALLGCFVVVVTVMVVVVRFFDNKRA